MHQQFVDTDAGAEPFGSYDCVAGVYHSHAAYCGAVERTYAEVVDSHIGTELFGQHRFALMAYGIVNPRQ